MMTTGAEALVQSEQTAGLSSVSQERQSDVSAEVPDRPALAPDVQLVGEMSGVGFKDRQWLLQRDGRFIQVTELIYRVAEQANGERTLEEIAEQVTASTDWMVDAEGVRHLIRLKLIPLGLMATAAGAVVGREEGPRSPLTINMRRNVLGPRVIERLTTVLQVFYAPPVLITVLTAATIAHVWLYRVHGIAEGIKDVLYTPGGLLMVLAIFIVSGIFHEFGHASALRYGGGRTRGMGVGFYLIYPAFYTDVTDSYRLGRWARVRTDLGGVYFHVIFALALIVLSLLLKQEFLLVAVLLINLEIITQFLPFVRFDGYWLLADLTGIPDFFSQMGGFVKNSLPGSGPKGGRPPAFKPWVKAAFITYTLVTIPLLAYFFFRTVRTLPDFLALTGEAFLKQAKATPVMLSQGEYLIALLLCTQLVFLALPVVGTFYVIFSVLRIPAQALWQWSKPTPSRRVAAALSVVVTLALVAYLWAPQVSKLTGSFGALSPTGKAAALIEQSRKATAALQGLRADLEGSMGPDRFTGSLLLKRPNLARVDVKGEEGLGEHLTVSDGKNLYMYFPEENGYVRLDPGDDGRNIDSYVAEQVEYFFRPDLISKSAAEGDVTYVGQQTIDNTAYDLVSVRGTRGGRKVTRIYYISPADHLVHQVMISTERKDGETGASWATIRNIRADLPIDEAAFRWSPPASAGQLQMPAGVTLPTSR